jgi:hypothetical protein
MSYLGIIIFGCLTIPKYKQQVIDCYATWVKDALNAGCLVRFYVGDIPDDISPELKALCINLEQGDDYLSATFKQWRGFEHMVESFEACDWYTTCGTDTFYNISNILQELQTFDSSKPYYIGGGMGKEPVDGKYYTYYSGGAGIFLSKPALVSILEEIPDFMPWWFQVACRILMPNETGEENPKSILGASDLQIGILCHKLSIQFCSLGSDRLVGISNHNGPGLEKEKLLSCHLMTHDDFYEYWSFIHHL